MAKLSIELIQALRTTSKKLKGGAHYEWGNMGSCNCGNLIQELTGLSKSEIHNYAMQKYGDWTEQVMDFCPVSGYPMDLLISSLLDKGLDLEDLKNLEKLSSPEVLRKLPQGIHLKFNVSNDVALYLELWANLLEDKLIQTININSNELLLQFTSDYYS